MAKGKEQETSWFTFGWGQAHHVGGVTYDPDVVVKITAPDPRLRMIELFGTKWSMEYDEEPDMSFYSRGVVELWVGLTARSRSGEKALR